MDKRDRGRLPDDAVTLIHTKFRGLRSIASRSKRIMLSAVRTMHFRTDDADEARERLARRPAKSVTRTNSTSVSPRGGTRLSGVSGG